MGAPGERLGMVASPSIRSTTICFLSNQGTLQSQLT
jgi:hypothetical protein